MFEITLTA